MESGNSTNATVAAVRPTWAFAPVYSTILCILTLVNNGLVLSMFIRNRRLRSNAFHCYLINLMVVNIFHALVHKPLEIILILYPKREHTETFCALFLPTLAISNALVMQSHVLITTNRVWAVISPFTYRNNHSIKTAIITCVCGWLFVCVLLLPGMLIDGLYLRGTADNVNCLLNTADSQSQHDWHLAYQIVLFIFPLFIVLLSYPLIWWKRHQRVRKRTAVSPVPSQGFPTHPSTTDSVMVGMPHPPKDNSKSFTLLTLLSLTVLICWTPLVAFFTGVSVYDEFHAPRLLQIAQILWAIEPVVDPIVFSIGIRDLRSEIGGLLKIPRSLYAS